jgi:excinuclease ABC subunit A
MTYRNQNGNEFKFSARLRGRHHQSRAPLSETNSEYIREKISEFMSDRPCPTCAGQAAQPCRAGRDRRRCQHHHGHILAGAQDPGLDQKDLGQEFNPHVKTEGDCRARDQRNQRAAIFLVNVGLDYLTLNRSAATLSGGEAQRIRLATQVGSRLVGVLYVLDEPSIGLHPRDNARLLKTLKACATWAIPCWSSNTTTRPSASGLDHRPGSGRR